MKDTLLKKRELIKFIVTFLLIITAYVCSGQHIEYRDKKKKPPENINNTSTEQNNVPRPDNSIKQYPADSTAKPAIVIEEKKINLPKDTIAKPVAITEDSSISLKKSRSILILNKKPKKPFVEDQNMCNLFSRPEVAAQLPLVINNVKPEMVKKLKERYEGRLYSITGLNMIDERLKFKLKLCDKDNGKFRSEYLDKDGNIINDPDLDYD